MNKKVLLYCFFLVFAAVSCVYYKNRDKSKYYIQYDDNSAVANDIITTNSH